MVLRAMWHGFKQPRQGRNNDKAHPPIHPVDYIASTSLFDEERRVYEFVVRRFLACCAEDALGEQTTISILYGPETFTANGLIVIQRNYLDVYPYDKWESSQQLPAFAMGETFVPTEARIGEGKTSAPGYLTEAELIALMTMGVERRRRRKLRLEEVAGKEERGDGEGEGEGGGGRGGAGGATARGGGSTGGVQEFIPTTLGVALIEGYDNLEFKTSLGKPFLREEVSSLCPARSSRGFLCGNHGWEFLEWIDGFGGIESADEECRWSFRRKPSAKVAPRKRTWCIRASSSIARCSSGRTSRLQC